MCYSVSSDSTALYKYCITYYYRCGYGGWQGGWVGWIVWSFTSARPICLSRSSTCCRSCCGTSPAHSVATTCSVGPSPTYNWLLCTPRPMCSLLRLSTATWPYVDRSTHSGTRHSLSVFKSRLKLTDTQIHEAPSIWGPGVERDIVQHRDMDIERIIEEKTQSVWN